MMVFTRLLLTSASLFVCTAGAALAAGTPTEIVQHDFAGPEGAHPLGGVIIGKDSSAFGGSAQLLGTAYSGGAHGKGVLFSIDSGALTVMHSFNGAGFPQAGLTAAADGTLFGTLSASGDRSASHDGSGGVFSFSKGGKYSLVHEFHGPEGSQPVAPVSLDASGNIVGTTVSGGVANGFSGTLFRITPDGTTTALVDFGKTSCQGPRGSLTFDATGNIVSTAWMSAEHPLGCVWSYATAGTFSKVHQFTNSIAGREPRGGVTRGTDGSLYGTAYYSGNFGPGDIYKLAPDGTATTLHHFTCAADGGYPNGDLLMDAKGVLYGVNASCGTGGGGVVFSYDTNTGVFGTVFSFTVNSGGGYLPIGPLSMDAAGNLYGTTEYGGANGLGVVFEIKR